MVIMVAITGKGYYETLEISNPVEHMTAANDATGGHVSENGGT
jgi:hypothetical protein